MTTTVRFASQPGAPRRRWRPVVASGVAVAVGTAALAGLVMFGPLCVVRDIEVREVAARGQSGASGFSGGSTPSAGRPASGGSTVRSAAVVKAVERLAAAHRGRPLARIDGDAVAASVTTQFPQVNQARVHRSWPSTLRVELVWRTPAAVLSSAGAYQLVDGAGVAYARVSGPARGLPVVRASGSGSGGRALVAALAVLRTLPSAMRQEIRSVDAETPDDIRLRLRQGEVVWGGVADAAFKARVLQVLLRQPGSVYDVSSPRTPVIR
ncbi:MAG: cell division protein FtsQ/DivIB [Angustibacter sp.]